MIAQNTKKKEAGVTENRGRKKTPGKQKKKETENQEKLVPFGQSESRKSSRIRDKQSENPK